MKLLFYTIFACFATVAYAAPRVVGGVNAPDGKYPYQVSLRRLPLKSHFCGGSIVNRRWILTAAHCVQYSQASSIIVVAGTNLIRNGTEQIYGVDTVIWNTDFDRSKLINDVALLRTSISISFGPRVQAIKLPTQDFNKVDYPANLTGWGTTRLGGSVPNNLQEITLRVIAQSRCKSLWNGNINITQSHICTLTKSGEGACHGDSGGPLVADGIQVGIVSFGQPCARGSPDVFTRVFTFINWINARIRNVTNDIE